jgi:hypothetical protein
MTNRFIRRYTTLPFLLDLLENKQIALLNPENWEDKNDAHYLNLYKGNKDLASVLALCFTAADETYHHWKVFAGNTAGVCIQYDKDKLFRLLNKVNGIRTGDVVYRKLKDARKSLLTPDELPFIKRYAFRDEKEVRVLFEDEREEMLIKQIKISLSVIDKIILNPWIPSAVYKSTAAVINQIDGCRSLRVNKTTLVDNEQWKKIGLRAGQ